MAERVGVQSNWVGKSRRQVQELKHLLTLPPTEAVDLVKSDETLPEDTKPGATEPEGTPAQDPGKSTPPVQDPAVPRAKDPSEPTVPTPREDEPGRVIL